MEALVFIDDLYEVATESYIDESKIEYIRLPDPAIQGDLATGIISLITGHIAVIASEYTQLVPTLLQIESFDDRAEVLFTTYVNISTVVQAERFINTTSNPVYNDLVILIFDSGNSILTTIDFTQIPTLFPNLS